MLRPASDSAKYSASLNHRKIYFCKQVVAKIGAFRKNKRNLNYFFLVCGLLSHPGIRLAGLLTLRPGLAVITCAH